METKQIVIIIIVVILILFLLRTISRKKIGNPEPNFRGKRKSNCKRGNCHDDDNGGGNNTGTCPDPCPEVPPCPSCPDCVCPDPKITIFHYPLGNPNNPETLTISVNALSAHYTHGDTLGACPGT
jgi:hypothetical protein